MWLQVHFIVSTKNTRFRWTEYCLSQILRTNNRTNPNTSVMEGRFFCWTRCSEWSSWKIYYDQNLCIVSNSFYILITLSVSLSLYGFCLFSFFVYIDIFWTHFSFWFVSCFSPSIEDIEKDRIIAKRLNSLSFLQPEHFDIDIQYRDEEKFQIAINGSNSHCSIHTHTHTHPIIFFSGRSLIYSFICSFNWLNW